MGICSCDATTAVAVGAIEYTGAFVPAWDTETDLFKARVTRGKAEAAVAEVAVKRGIVEAIGAEAEVTLIVAEVAGVKVVATLGMVDTVVADATVTRGVTDVETLGTRVNVSGDIIEGVAATGF